MSNKKRRRAISAGVTRDAPTSSAAAWLCSADAYKMLCCGEYTRLRDCPEVRMCVHIYADMISSMTLHLMRNTALGDVRIVNQLSRKLDIEPNRYVTRKVWMYNIVYTMLTDGDGNQVTYPRYAADGMLDELIPVRPSQVSYMDTADGYTIRINGQVFAPDELLHFRINPDPERPYIGTGYRAVLKDVAKGLRQANATKKALMEAPTPSIIVKVDGLTEEFASVEGRKKLAAQYLDSSESGQPWFIPAEMFSVEQIKPLTLNDLAIAKSLELDKRTVAGIFGVPAYMVGVGNYDKAEHNAFVTTRIMPMAREIEQELTRKLLYSPDLYWRFNPRSLYAYDIGEIINAGAQMVDRMALRRNEWRDWAGFGPDEEMQELLALENYIPADRLGDQAKLIGGDGDGQSND